MPEDRRNDLVEVWTNRNGVRSRVWRGRNPEHLAWKLEHHKLDNPEKIIISAGEHDTGELAPA